MDTAPADEPFRGGHSEPTTLHIHLPAELSERLYGVIKLLHIVTGRPLTFSMDGENQVILTVAVSARIDVQTKILPLLEHLGLADVARIMAEQDPSGGVGYIHPPEA